jgi:hypothetical protein
MEGQNLPPRARVPDGFRLYKKYLPGKQSYSEEAVPKLKFWNSLRNPVSFFTGRAEFRYNASYYTGIPLFSAEVG